jgi:hypothetical protein
MASYMTSATLVESVKRRENIPASQNTFETVDFLAFANEEISIGILPSLLQFHEEFLVYAQEIDIVSGKSSYQIPSRAVGAKIRAIYYKDSNGDLQEFARVQPEDLTQFKGSNARIFYLQNNSIVFPIDLPAGSLVVYYYMRPNQLVDVSEVAVVSSIDRTTGIIAVESVPDGFSVNDPIDFLELKGGHRSLDIDVSPVSINATTNEITFAVADIPEDLVVGDHIALAGQCMIPQIPDDLHVVLAQRVAARCLEALGDQNGLNAANVKIAEIESRMGNLIDNRAEGNPQKVVNKFSFLARNNRFTRR